MNILGTLVLQELLGLGILDLQELDHLVHLVLGRHFDCWRPVSGGNAWRHWHADASSERNGYGLQWGCCEAIISSDPPGLISIDFYRFGQFSGSDLGRCWLCFG